MNILEIMLEGFDTRLSKKELIEIMENPLWEERGSVHDWRNYVPESVQEIWPYLGWGARALAVIMADEQAGDEEWE